MQFPNIIRERMADLEKHGEISADSPDERLGRIVALPLVLLVKTGPGPAFAGESPGCAVQAAFSPRIVVRCMCRRSFS